MYEKLKKILKWNYYQNKKFYKSLINKDDLCFDIGANVGTKSKLFLSLNARVIAFEPQSTCIEHLKKIKHPQFSYFKWGVGAINGVQKLQLANHIEVATFSQNFIDFFKNENLQWNQNENVTIKKIDTLIDEFGIPDYCKIDVEGYEYNILSHLNHQIPIIEFEFTEAFFSETIKCIKLLDTSNRVYNYNLNECPKFELESWVSAKEIITIFKKLPKTRLHGNIFVKQCPI